jgi:outer membrane protein assembly factor BamB
MPIVVRVSDWAIGLQPNSDAALWSFGGPAMPVCGITVSAQRVAVGTLSGSLIILERRAGRVLSSVDLAAAPRGAQSRADVTVRDANSKNVRISLPAAVRPLALSGSLVVGTIGPPRSSWPPLHAPYSQPPPSWAQLFVFDLAATKLLWRGGAVTRDNIRILGQQLFAGGSGVVNVYELRTGRSLGEAFPVREFLIAGATRERYDTLPFVVAGPDSVIVGSGDWNRLALFSLRSGPDWSQATWSADLGNVAYALAATGIPLAAGEGDTTLGDDVVLALRRYTGQGQPWAPPDLVTGVAALDARTGRLIWMRSLLGGWLPLLWADKIILAKREKVLQPSGKRAVDTYVLTAALYGSPDLGDLVGFALRAYAATQGAGPQRYGVVAYCMNGVEAWRHPTDGFEDVVGADRGIVWVQTNSYLAKSATDYYSTLIRPPLEPPLDLNSTYVRAALLPPSSSQLMALDLGTGRLLWRKEGMALVPVWSSPELADVAPDAPGHTYAFGESARVLAWDGVDRMLLLDARTGLIVHTYTVGH